YQLLRYFDRKTPLRFFFMSVLIAFLFLSHNPMALVFPPLLACISIYKAVLEKRMSLIWDFFKLFIIGIMLSSFFIAPAVLEKKYISLSKLITGITDFHNHFVYFYQFFSPFWGYEWSLKGPIDGMSFQLGVINVLAVIMVFFLYSKLNSKDKFSVSFILVIFFLSMFLMMRQSEGLWEIIPYLQYMWLPWRFLAITGFLSSILAGLVFSKLFKEESQIDGLSQIFFIAIIIILSALPCLNKRDYYTKGEVPVNAEDIRATKTTTSYQDEFLPIWVNKKPENLPSAKIESLSLSLKITQISIKPYYYEFTCSNSDSSNLIKINTFYFPGWKAYVNGEEERLLYEGEFNGIMHHKMSTGESKVVIEYTGTKCQKISQWVSLLTLLILVIFTISCIRKDRNI
ncbi:hypothetical protein KKB18_09000, partial [bacterium]|nr:hypothetical protein [bacterium]